MSQIPPEIQKALEAVDPWAVLQEYLDSDEHRDWCDANRLRRARIANETGYTGRIG